jgi:CRP-like cAMP-binding protein
MNVHASTPRGNNVSAVFRDKDRLDHIVRILQVPAELRSKEEELDLVNFLMQTEIFTRANNIDTVAALAREVELKQLIEGEYVFRQGELGTCFYVILQGSVHGLAKSEEYDEFG